MPNVDLADHIFAEDRQVSHFLTYTTDTILMIAELIGAVPDSEDINYPQPSMCEI